MNKRFLVLNYKSSLDAQVKKTKKYVVGGYRRRLQMAVKKFLFVMDVLWQYHSFFLKFQKVLRR